MVGFAVGLNVRKPIDCQALYTFIQTMGSLGSGLAVVNLGIRTWVTGSFVTNALAKILDPRMAIWMNQRYVVGGLVVLILGHWGLILRDVNLVVAQWSDGAGCIITNNQPHLITAAYIYTMVLDLTVMCLMAYKLGVVSQKRAKLSSRFLVNTIAVVFSALNLNPVMSVIALIPATVIASIAACRAVRRLSTFISSEESEICIEGSQQPGKGSDIELTFRVNTVTTTHGDPNETRLKRLKTEAKSGSRVAVQELEKIISQHPQFVPELVSILLHHIPTTLPDSSTMDDAEKATIVGLTQSAIAALAEATIAEILCAEVLLEDQDYTPTLIDEIREAWPRIWSWVTFLFDSYLNPISDIFHSAVPIDDMVEYPVTIHYALSKFLFAVSQSTLDPLLREAENVVQIVIDLLLNAAGNISYVSLDIERRNTIPDAFHHTKRLFLAFWNNPGESNITTKLMDRLRDDSVQSFAVGLITRLIFAARNPLMDSISRSIHSILWLTLSFGLFCHQFDRSLVAANSVYWVCVAIRGLASIPGELITMDHIKALRAGADYIVTALKHFGYSVAIEALKTGILKSLLNSGQIIAREEEECNHNDKRKEKDPTVGRIMIPEFYIDIIRRIGTYTVYATVCSVASKALSRVDSMESPPALTEEFATFVEQVEQRTKLKVKYDQIACSSRKCPYLEKDPKEGERIPRFRCSGCEDSYYCSIECQKSDWKRHKDECEETRLEKALDTCLTPKADLRDRGFFSFMMVDSLTSTDEEEVSKWLAVALMHEHSRRKRLDVQPDEPLVTVLDYEKFPYDFKVITVREAKRLDKHYDWDTLVAKFRKSDDTFVPILTIAPFPHMQNRVWIWPMRSVSGL
ncbi:hypothetical protein VNI00_008603 [Paramarasmius palmivorus]|uniref:MYND-type domain-containing protein n=1 Tax=Paramarasmius palmivorus TaxID=297713 RepID=A0AAW0CX69_9AGAR